MSTSPAIVTTTAIRRARPDELDLVATTLADAFQADPIMSWCIPDDDRRRRILPQFFAVVAEAIAGYDEIDLAPGGAAMWVPPGSPVVPEAAEEGFGTALAELLGDDAMRAFELVSLMDEHHPDADHHYLWFVGVANTHRGLGLGSALVGHGLAAADEAAMPAYLEATSRDNVRLYERHGFAVVGELSAAGSPPLWSMWREPTTNGGATGC